MASAPMTITMANIVLIIIIMCLIVVVTNVATKHHCTKSSYCDIPDYGIRQRGDVVFSGTGFSGKSLNDSIDDAAHKTSLAAVVPTPAPAQVVASPLTGSRDVPVFFQGYDYDAAVKGGSIKQAREGLTNKGGKALSFSELSKIAGQ